MTASDFFIAYKKWEEEKYKASSKSKILKISDSNGKTLSLNSKSIYNLASFLSQLDQDYRKGPYISEKEYYLGEEPDFQVIQKNYDVVKQKKIGEIKKHILFILDEHQKKHETFVPIIFLKGSFGTGKTTFTYRVIKEITSEPSNECIAFDIIDTESLQNQQKYIINLLETINAKLIIFYCDNIEVDFTFKAILDLRLNISSKQVPGKQIVFLLSIRENILERNKETKYIGYSHEFNIDTSLQEMEVEQLLEKLKRNSILDFRDVHEKRILKNKIIKNYKGDTFLSLLELATEGRHLQDLISAYSQLSEDCKKAFVYTALLHRFGLYMPAGLLKNLVSRDWEEFTKKIIMVEGKGILGVRQTSKRRE